MKTTRKLLALVLVLTLALSMATTAFAAGSIKVEGTSNNEYTVFKFLDKVTVEGGVAYKLADGWADFATHPGVSTYLTFTNGYANWVNASKSSATVAALAELAKGYIAAKGLTSTLKVYASDGSDSAMPNTVPVADNGYYVLVSDAGHSGIIEVSESETAKVTDKNPDGGGVGGGGEAGLPNVKKEVQEDSNSNWGEANTADIGQTITFKTTITVGKGGTNYVLHDTMDSHLTFIGISSVKDQNGTDVPYTLVNPITDGHTFDISFSNDYLATLDDNDQIIVTYTAYINDTAAAGTGYVNETWLTHGDGLKTSPDSTTSKTFGLTINKTDDNNDPLKGAGFTFVGTTFKLVGSNGVYTVCALTTGCTHAHVTEAMTDDSGKIKITGLDADTYTLEETTIPAGYVKAANTEATINNSTTAYHDITIQNVKGQTLPETGGMGTTLFYTVGGIMVLAAVVLLITKKRMAVK